MKLAALRRELRALADPAQAEVSQRYFKEPERFLGIRAPDLRKVVRQHVDLPLRSIESLLASPWHEERMAALLILVHRYRREPDAVFELYLRNTSHIDNWDLVDLSAPHIVGAHLFARDRSLLYELARSASVWERRIAILATQHFIRNGQFADTLALARVLLRDPHDLIHKAAGWMLREVANRDRAVVDAFLDEHASQMPRTMLHYAIEKFPEGVRRRYLNSSFRP